nr:putative RNA-directed DNA polymerase [Tanacetum cinerariifolium]
AKTLNNLFWHNSGHFSATTTTPPRSDPATLVLPSDSIIDQIYISGPQAFYCVRLPNNNMNNNNHGNRNNSRGNNNNRGRDTGANSHVKPDLEAMDNSEAYYGDNALHVGNRKGLSILHIVSSKVYSPQKTLSLKNALRVPEISHKLLSVQKFCYDNDTTSTPTPPLPTPHHPSLDNVLQIFVKIPTSFIVANNSAEWRQAMKEEYDALIKNGAWSLVPRASNTKVVKPT